MQLTLSFATLALVSLAAANPIEVRQNTDCNTGSLQCCQSTEASASPSTAELLGNLGAVIQGVTGLIGLTCSGITGVGLTSSSCNAQPVCCTNNNFNGVVALGCTPINVGL